MASKWDETFFFSVKGQHVKCVYILYLLIMGMYICLHVTGLPLYLGVFVVLSFLLKKTVWRRRVWLDRC